MTRYTNFARKRTYVQAGFNYRDDADLDSEQVVHEEDSRDAERSTEEMVEASPKSNKRRQKEPHSSPVEPSDSAAQEGKPDEQQGKKGVLDQAGDALPKGQKKPPKDKRVKDAQARKQASERRRLKRKDERDAGKICFACREKGHSARNCTKAMVSVEGDDGKNRRGKAAKNAVGICYRCGSRKHNLSKCKEQPDPSNPLPFASCFVCSGKGHLASACPQNQAKGIYPNGGCCKLCGETTHLAKDCSLRKKEVANSTVFLGTGHGAGADEDDFHTFKRRNTEVDKTEKLEERVIRQAKVKVGAHSGVVKSFGKAPATEPKKVVYF